MPRIRTIKPEFWDSPDTAQASLRTRLLYIAMWNWADDYGIGDATPVRVIAFAFPHDDIPASEYPRLLKDVADAFGVVFFRHDGRPYYVIPAWNTHQRTERKAKPKPELMEAAMHAVAEAKTAVQQQYSEHPSNVAEVPTPSVGSSEQPRGSTGPGTGEQGNRGTGEIHAASNNVSTDRARESDDEPPPRGPVVDADGWRLVRAEIPDDHPHPVRTDLAIRAGALLKSGTPEADVRDALVLWLTKPTLGPGVLPSLVSEIVRTRNRPATSTAPHGSTADQRVAQAQAVKAQIAARMAADPKALE